MSGGGGGKGGRTRRGTAAYYAVKRLFFDVIRLRPLGTDCCELPVTLSLSLSLTFCQLQSLAYCEAVWVGFARRLVQPLSLRRSVLHCLSSKEPFVQLVDCGGCDARSHTCQHRCCEPTKPFPYNSETNCNVCKRAIRGGCHKMRPSCLLLSSVYTVDKRKHFPAPFSTSRKANVDCE